MASANVGLVNKGIGFGMAVLAGLALAGNWGCAIRENVNGGDGRVAVEVKDSSNIDLDFDVLTKREYRDSGELNLKSVRDNLASKDIALSDVEITDLVVTYDDSTKAFLEANKGVKYYLRLYVKNVDDTSAGKLALKTYKVTPEGGPQLTLDPAIALFELNKTIFPDVEGYSELVTAIKDVSKEKIFVIAVLTFLEDLKATGPLRLKVVVSVGSKV